MHEQRIRAYESDKTETYLLLCINTTLQIYIYIRSKWLRYQQEPCICTQTHHGIYMLNPFELQIKYSLKEFDGSVSLIRGAPRTTDPCNQRSSP
jgi:hypothetical protein